MALAINSNTPALSSLGFLAANGTRATPAFSPPANSTLLFFFLNNAATGTFTVTDSVGLTWTKVNDWTESTSAQTTAWTAPSTSAQTNMTVTGKNGATAGDVCVGCVVFTGASSTPVGQTASSVGAGSASAVSSSITVNSTASGSFVILLSMLAGTTTTPTFNSGDTDVFGSSTLYGADTNNVVNNVIATSTSTTSGGSVTIGTSAPTTTFHVFLNVGIEILAGASAAPSFFVPNTQIPFRMPLGC